MYRFGGGAKLRLVVSVDFTPLSAVNEIKIARKQNVMVTCVESLSMVECVKHILEAANRFFLDCVHTMPAHFENGEKFDG